MKSRVKASLLVVALAAMAVPALAQEKAAAPVKSLYERLGGVYNIAAVVDAFIERLFANDTLNANPAIYKARSVARKPGLKVQVSNLVCAVTGGPCKYTGLDMKTAHVNFHITEKEWDAMVSDFKTTLDDFKVPPAEQKELIDIVATTKPDIVVAAATAK